MSVRVLVPQLLRNYTQGASVIEVNGRTIDDALNDVDARFKGFRFRVVDEQGRIRPHMRVFVDGARAKTIAQKLRTDSEIHIFGALSGG